MSRSHCRCSRCEARRVFKLRAGEPISAFKQRLKSGDMPACRNCGHRLYRIDGWMNSRDTKGQACNCPGYTPFTTKRSGMAWELHRKGSPYCWYRKDGSQRMPGDADFKDLYYEQLQGVTQHEQEPERTAA